MAWAQGFGTLIFTSPGLYGLVQAQAQAFQVVSGNLLAAWNKVIDPATKTKVTVADKDVALQAMKDMARDLVSVIQGTPSVTPGMKI